MRIINFLSYFVSKNSHFNRCGGEPHREFIMRSVPFEMGNVDVLVQMSLELSNNAASTCLNCPAITPRHCPFFLSFSLLPAAFSSFLDATVDVKPSITTSCHFPVPNAAIVHSPSSKNPGGRPLRNLSIHSYSFAHTAPGFSVVVA